ncbi:MAG: hypothetical protein ACO1QR_13720 [Chthoniobacteraceae bacterium]
MEHALNSSQSVRYLQAVIRLHPTEAFTTPMELRKALDGTVGVDSALVEAEEVIVCFDPLQITERAIESLLRQTGREPADVEINPFEAEGSPGNRARFVFRAS